MGEYDDILNLPHHRSLRHRPLSAESRAAQFSPFAALAGYEEALAESARLTCPRRCLGEDEAEALDAALRCLRERLQTGTAVAQLSYFAADARKAGGAYVKRKVRARRLEAATDSLYLDDGSRIALSDLVWLQPEDEQRTDDGDEGAPCAPD